MQARHVIFAAPSFSAATLESTERSDEGSTRQPETDVVRQALQGIGRTLRVKRD